MGAAEPWTRGDVLGALGLATSLLGFTFAWIQLRRTKKAAQATQDALRKSNQTQLLFLLPQFRQFELELDFAVESGERTFAARALSSYSFLADEVAALAEELSLADQIAVGEMRAAAAAATQAKNTIYTARTKKLSTIVDTIREPMSAMQQQVSRLRSLREHVSAS